MQSDHKLSPGLDHVDKDGLHVSDGSPAYETGDVKDVAKDYIKPGIVITEEMNKQLFKKINKRILPVLCLAYFCQALDKSTTGIASIMGLQADTNMHGQDYALTSTVLWIGIIAGEFPANRIVQRFPTARVLGIAIILWGLLLIGPAFLKQAPPFLAFRFLLGLFESCVGPAIFVIMVMWYKKTEQALVTGVWQATFGIGTIVSGLIGYAFLHVKNNSLAGWRILFLAVAGFSVIAGTVVLFYLPNTPADAKWATPEEKILFVERVRENDQGIKDTTFRWPQAKEAFTDPYCWLLFFTIVFNTLVVGGINTFSQLLINKAFGFTAAQSQLLNMPLGVMSILAYLTAGFVANKTGQTCLTMCGLVIPNFIATILLITIAPTSKTKGGLVVVFYFCQIFQACNPLIFSSMSRNIAGGSKKTIAYAMVFVGWAGGNAIASQLFQSKWAPRYKPSLYIHLGIYAIFIGTVLFTRQFLIRRNRAKIAAQEMTDGTDPNLHMHAFEGLTDRENPDFRYSI